MNRAANSMHPSAFVMQRFAIGIAVFLIGIGSGYFFFSGPREAQTQNVDQSPSNSARREVASPETISAPTDEKTQRLMLAAGKKGGQALERDNERYLAINALTAEDFRLLMADLGAVKTMIEKFGEAAANMTSGLIDRWLKVDRESALKWLPGLFEVLPKSSRSSILDALAKRRPEELLGLVSSSETKPADRKSIISRALAELATRDLPKAQAWLNGSTDADDRKVAEKAIRTGIAKADPLRAMEIAAEITDPDERRRIVSVAAERAAQIGPGMLRQLATQPLKDWMLPLVLNHFANHDPVAALDLALKCQSEGWEKRSSLTTAFGALARQNPELAIAKLEELNASDRALAIAQIGNSWSVEDPKAALDWLASKPANVRTDPDGGRSYGSSDSLLIAYASWTASAPDAARAWADALPPGETRNAIQSQRARILAANGSVAEATRILTELGAAASPKDLSTIASAWAQQDPAAAAEWAINQPAGAPQASAIASVVGTWASDDPDSAATWLEQFPPGEARDRSIVAFLGRQNAFLSPTETRIAQFEQWFDRIDDPWHRANAAMQCYWALRNRDPDGAAQWLQSLPNVDPGLIRLTLVRELR